MEAEFLVVRVDVGKEGFVLVRWKAVKEDAGFHADVRDHAFCEVFLHDFLIDLAGFAAGDDSVEWPEHCLLNLEILLQSKS